MPVVGKKPVNPIFILILSLPHFLLGALLTAINWQRLGFPDKARNTVRWSIFGTVALLILAVYIPQETLVKLWPVGIGINIGTGMAFRTLQLPEIEKAGYK